MARPGARCWNLLMLTLTPGSTNSRLDTPRSAATLRAWSTMNGRRLGGGMAAPAARPGVIQDRRTCDDDETTDDE
jgi:hypothetical protein